MAELWELGYLNLWNHVNLKDQLVMTTLKTVKAQGHPYVDIRRERKRLIFFCCLCYARCFGDLNLYNHLNGKRHKKNMANANQTLMKPNPWPFDDGLFFFHNVESEKADKGLDVTDEGKGKGSDEDEEGLAVVDYGSNLDGNDGTSHQLVIPGVLQNDRVSDLVVRKIGAGIIVASYTGKDSVSSEIHRIWCEWLGTKDVSSRVGGYAIPDLDFAVVSFLYDYNLGRAMIVEDPRYLLPSSSYIEAESSNASAENSDPSNTLQSAKSHIVFSKDDRKRVFDQFTLASARVCNICMQKFFPGKDVAALLNRKTGKLVCSSRNPTGAFHIFHVSCLIHWILHCEVQMHANEQQEQAVERPKKRRKRTGKKNEQNPEPPKRTVFCPDCQGSGIEIDGHAFEKPTVNLDEIFNSKVNLCLARQEWLGSPELLDNCSTGFTFHTGSGGHVERLTFLNQLSFYRAAKK